MWEHLVQLSVVGSLGGGGGREGRRWVGERVGYSVVELPEGHSNVAFWVEDRTLFDPNINLFSFAPKKEKINTKYIGLMCILVNYCNVVLNNIQTVYEVTAKRLLNIPKNTSPRHFRESDNWCRNTGHCSINFTTLQFTWQYVTPFDSVIIRRIQLIFSDGNPVLFRNA